MATVADLGPCTLLRSNSNYLRQCVLKTGQDTKIPGKRELLWTDGDAVWLLPTFFGSHLEESTYSRGDSLLMGQFGNTVIGTACSSFTVIKQGNKKKSEGNFIAVVLRDKVLVLFREVGESAVRLVKQYFWECSPQGYEWHPTRPLLFLLSRKSAVLLRFSAGFVCEEIPVQTFFRNLSASAWSSDGKKLAVAAQENLLIFGWKDFCQLNVFTCVKWSSLETSGKISCVIPWQSSSFIISTDLPLDKLCTEEKCDFFEVNNLDHSFAFETSTDDLASGSSADSSLNSEELTLALKPKARDHGNPLLMFTLKNSRSQALSSKAQLILVHCEGDKPREISRTVIEGLISPDLLLFQSVSRMVVVGSHSSNRLHCYTLLPSPTDSQIEVRKAREINLDTYEKPKGMTTIPGHVAEFLVLVGVAEDATDIAFPPSACYKHYSTILKRFNTSTECSNTEDSTCATVEGISARTRSSLFLRLPDGSEFQDSEMKGCLISEVHSTEDSMLGGCFRREIINKNSNEDQRSLYDRIEKLETALKALESHIDKRLFLLDRRLDDIFSKQTFNHGGLGPYPLLESAEYVRVVWTDELTGAVGQDNFLLDKGRLSLQTIQKAYSASLVRISVGEVPCIVSAGEDGFIPVKFLRGSTVHMSGHSVHQ